MIPRKKRNDGLAEWQIIMMWKNLLMPLNCFFFTQFIVIDNNRVINFIIIEMNRRCMLFWIWIILWVIWIVWHWIRMSMLIILVLFFVKKAQIIFWGSLWFSYYSVLLIFPLSKHVDKGLILQVDPSYTLAII